MTETTPKTIPADAPAMRSLVEKARIMSADDMRRAISRLSHEIIERIGGPEDVIICGIRTRGQFLAERIVKKIKEIEDVRVPLGILDITLYRDDLQTVAKQPVVRSTEIPVSIVDKHVVLVDDVLYTGRTIRAAMDEVIDFGRPKTIQLAVLVDRGHREFPIRADYVGKNVPTSQNEVVKVQFAEVDGADSVVVLEFEEES
ncbi:MAG: bifunctional protein PyrR [Gemmatimonadota bacterium]|nr:MAG: bifunctional protein PyrR [Gemmatimonadota bacterium]